MKYLALILATLGLAVPATAAVSAKTFYLRAGDTAIPGSDAVLCTARRAGGFLCKTGGDYRGRHGVIITVRSLMVTRYTSFSRYRVVKTYSMQPAQ